MDRNKFISQNDYLKENLQNKKSAYFYGYGTYAKVLSIFLRKKGITVNGYILDKEYLNKVVKTKSDKLFHWEEILNKKENNYFICNGITSNPKKLNSKFYLLNKPRFVDVIDFLNIDQEFLTADWVNANKEEIKNLDKYLYDQRSKEVLNQFVKNKLDYNLTNSTEFIDFGPLYFNKKIKPKNNEIYIDIGAYNGDTLLEYAEYNSKFSHIYLFEPNNSVNQKLKSNIAKIANKKNITLYRYALSNQISKRYLSKENLTIMSKLTNNNLLAENKELLITRKLDEFFLNKFYKESVRIKLDINGYELKALEGGLNFIKEKKPIIITKLQTKENLIKIPKLLKEVDSKYKIFLRQRGMGSLMLMLYETV